MRFFVLGPLEIETDDGRSHGIGSANQRAILAMLLANTGTIISTDEFIDALWADDPPPSARPTLRTYISRIRKLVGTRLIGHDDGYSLVFDTALPGSVLEGSDEIDALAFEDDVAAGRFSEALQRWRGRPFGDAADLNRVRGEVARLEALAATARAGQVGELLTAGRLAEATASAEAVVLDDPLNEPAWAGLVRALSRSGRIADALRAYQRAVHALVDAGLAPGADLRAAESEALSDPQPEPANRRRVPPVPLNASVGIAAEVERVLQLTEQRRLVTIVGPGGVGKTRLSLEVGRRAAKRHALGTRVVELSRAGNPGAIGPTVRRALDLAEHDLGASEGLGAVDALLVLDNCEHVIEEVAALVPTLLAGGDRLCVLATSREPLRVAGEQRWALPPLATDGPDSPALSLFMERADEVGARVDPADPSAQSIVARLDGLPLAIEMAAARLSTTSLAELADDLARNMAALQTSHRDANERHSTLRAVLGWSEALLDPTQRRTLADFAVFAGPVVAEDLPATVAAPDAAGAVRELVDRSLITVETTGGRARFGSLETVRQFGRERLTAEDRFGVVAERHARWFTEVAERARREFEGPAQIDAVRRIDETLDELRAAHLWSRTHQPALAHRLSRALFQPALQGLRLEILEWAQALAEATGPDDPEAPELYGEVSAGLVMIGRTDEACEWAERAISAADSPEHCRVAFSTISDAALYVGDLDRSLEFARRHELVAEQFGSPIERAYGSASVALSLAYLGRHEEALARIPSLPSDASPTAFGWLAYARGEVLLDLDTEAARRELDTAVTLADSVGSHFLSGVAQVSAASSRARTGEAEDAIGPLIATIERFADRGAALHLLTTLRNLPALLIRVEEWHAAATLLGGLSTITISPTYGDEADRLAIAEETALAALGEDAFARAHADGKNRDLDAIARATIDVLTRLDQFGRPTRPQSDSPP